MLPALPDSLFSAAPPRELLQALLGVSLGGIVVFRPLYASQPDPAALTDLAFAYVNPAAQRLLGLPECPPDSFLTWCPGARDTGLFAFHCEAFQTGQPTHYAANDPHTLCPNYGHLAAQRVGDLLVVSFTAPPTPEQPALAESQRQLQELNLELEARVFERTQALRHARAETLATAQRLAHLTESLPSTTFLVDQTGQVLYLSPQWYAYTGMAASTPINEAWPQFIHPADLPAVAQEYAAALAEGRAWAYEFRLRGADGRYRWFASQGVPEPLAEAQQAGRPRQWFGANLDVDALKQAQHDLEQQRQQLTDILSSVPAGVVLFEGEDLRYRFFNHTFQGRVQGRAELGRTLTELFPEAEEQGYPARLRQVLRTGQPYRAHEARAYVHNPDTGEQQEMFLDLAYLPLRHGAHPPHAVLAFTVEVTERVRARQATEAAQAQLLTAAEQAATQREAFFQVFEQTPALVALLREPGHRVEYANPAYQALFPGRQLIGFDLGVAVPELREQGFAAILDRVFLTGETYFGTDTPFVRAPTAGQPARTTYYNFTYQAYRENGRIAGVSIFAFDVTEQVLARQEREAQRQQLHELFQQAPAPLVIFDGPELVYQLANPAYQRIFPGRDLLGKPLLEALPELVGNPLIEELHHAYRTGKTYVAQELPLLLARTEGGPLEEIYWTFTYKPRRNAAGQVDGVLVFAHEVTDQVQARRTVEEGAQQARVHAEQLAAANQQLTRANIDLDTFVYTASHDLKAPITNIEGLLYTLRGELPAPVRATGEVPYILDLMQNSVERFKHTIEHLTDISKLQKTYDQPASAVQLAPIIEGVRLDLAPLMQQTGAQLQVDVAVVPAITFSEKNLRSIVYNLLSNALKYHHPSRPPRVQVRAWEEGEYAVLAVQDNGLGFEAGRENQLFGLFQRLHTHVEGSGVGLYMVKRLLENAGGRIAVTSALGEGTTFTLYFPR